MHLAIGRLTRSAEPPAAEGAALFFERLNHLNLARSSSPAPRIAPSWPS